MAQNLKHQYIYVLELKRIVTPSKARLAFLSNLNHCDKFHYYCRFCGVKLKGRNIIRPKLGEKQQQPSCSDWQNVKHKYFCESLEHKVNTGGGTDSMTPVNISLTTEVFIPEYLTFEIPQFIINQQTEIPEEIDLATIHTAPVDFDIQELKRTNATYLLSDVIEAYNWVLEQKIHDNESPKVTLGNKGYPNKYTKLIKPLKNMVFTDNPVIYSGTFNLKYAANVNSGFCFYSLELIKNSHRLKIIIPSQVSNGTILEKSIQQLIELKKSSSKSKQPVEVKFYFTSYALSPEPVTRISNHGTEYKEYVIEITNPYLIILIPCENEET